MRCECQMVCTLVCTKKGIRQNTSFIRILVLEKIVKLLNVFMQRLLYWVVHYQGYIHPPLDMTFFQVGLVLFPFCSCLLCICVSRFPCNTQQLRTFFCSPFKNCHNLPINFPNFNYATITYFYCPFFCLFVCLPQLLPLWWQLQLLGAFS